ncbi:MAG: hypothetical protein K2Y22_17025 [Candidatus Obscuribacterales bacterium]|nr:hypothetical protein [Candidatus Obscuribacterales bacterium]
MTDLKQSRVIAVFLVFSLMSSFSNHNLALASQQDVQATQTDAITQIQDHTEEPAIAYIATNDREKLQLLTNKIVQKELGLLKINTYFRLETTEQSRIKPWRVFAFNLAGAGVANAGITTIAAERWQTWRNPAKADRTTLKAGPLLLLISHSIVTAGLLTEMCFDAVGDYKRKKKGMDIKTATKKVKAAQVELQDLLSQREALIKNSTELSSQDAKLANAEGLILKDLRDLSLVEYSKFYTRGIKRRVSRDLSYFNGLAAATTGGYIGSLCGLLAICDRKPKLAGPAGIGFILSGAFITVAPIINRYGSKFAGNLAKKKIAKELGGLNSTVNAQLGTDVKNLQAYTVAEQTANEDSFKKRLLVYSDVQEILKNQNVMDAKEKAKADREFRERLLFNSAIGGTKMGWGIQLANAGFSYHPAPAWPKITRTLPFGGSKVVVTIPRPKVPHTPAQLFSKRVAEGATTYIPGTGIWIIDALQSRARGEMEVFTMGSQQALPHQKVKQRLEKLEQLELSLNQP